MFKYGVCVWARCKLPQRVRAELGRQTVCGAFWGGGAENARVENAELENPPPNRRGGKRGTGKRGNLKVMESRRCRKCAT